MNTNNPCDFSDALFELVNNTNVKILREGWNGKGMFLFLVSGGPMDHPALEDTKEQQDYIAMKTAQNTVVPWLASQSDILANDWIVETFERKE